MVAVIEQSMTEHNLGPAERIPAGEGRTFQVGPMEVAVFRTRNGEIYATQALCPHKDGPLADGMMGGGKIICPLHSYKFDLQTGAPIGNDCAALRTYKVSVDGNGDILLVIDDPILTVESEWAS